MNRIIMTLVAVFSLVLLTGCDPNKEALEKGKNLDIHRTDGKVILKQILYFNGNNSYTKEMAGKPYTHVRIQRKNTNGAVNNEDFYGVPNCVFDVIEPGTILPLNWTVTREDLSKLEGEIIDRQADFENMVFWFVVDTGLEIKPYRTDVNTFYRYIKFGQKLPMDSASLPGGVR